MSSAHLSRDDALVSSAAVASAMPTYLLYRPSIEAYHLDVILRSEWLTRAAVLDVGRLIGTMARRDSMEQSNDAFSLPSGFGEKASHDEPGARSPHRG